MARVTLSFDNGPDAEATPRVLDILADAGIRSTFFVVGERLAAPGARALAERAHAEGHWIGNHTFTHSTPLGVSDDPDAPEKEIGRTQDEIADLAHADRLFRPFGGGGHLDGRLLSRAALDYLLAGGYTCVLWNSVPGDWRDEDGWVDHALADVERGDWTLVVLHDIAGAAAARLEAFLAMLRARGHDIVQSFPPECVPLVRGKAVRHIAVARRRLRCGAADNAQGGPR